MAHVIFGAIVGFFLAVPLLSLIEESEFYYSRFYTDTVDNYLGIVLAAICALVGGYIGSRLNQYHIKGKEAGRKMNKNAEYAGKIMVIFVVLALFVFMTALDVQNDYLGIRYIHWATLVIPIIASMFAIISLVQINRTKEIGILVAVTTLIIAALFYIFRFQLLVF